MDVTMSSQRQSCLIILSSAIEGVSAQSFIQAFSLTQTAFNVQLASPHGKPIEYVQQDDNSRRWLNDFRTKSFSLPVGFETIEEPICCIGMGVAGLCSLQSTNQTWGFSSYSMTAISVFELARTPYFGSLSLIPEDYIKDHGAKYSCSEPDAVHVVVDRHVITGQNEESTLTAVQNLILLCNHRQGKLLTTK